MKRDKKLQDIEIRYRIMLLATQISPMGDEHTVPEWPLIGALDALEAGKRTETDTDYNSIDSLKVYLHKSIANMDADQVQQAYRFIRCMLN